MSARVAGAVLLLATAMAASGAGLPRYSVTFLGAGAVADISEDGVVIGSAGAGQGPRAWVWKQGARETLPLPAGMTLSEARAVNARGVIVGWVAASPQAATRAVKWLPREGVYVAELIEGPAGRPALLATGIDDAGTIVGVALAPPRTVSVLGKTRAMEAKRAFRSPPGGEAQFIEAFGEISYTWIQTVRAPQINARGAIYDGVRTILHADGRVERVPPVAIGSGTYEFNGFINDAGELAGHVGLTGSSMASTMVAVRHTAKGGWVRYPHFALPHGALTAFNARGDAAYFGGPYAPGPMVEHAGGGQRAPQDLLLPEHSAWELRGAALLNDRGWLVSGGRNAVTRQAGLVLLRPVSGRHPGS
jgi:hypothetical protein